MRRTAASRRLDGSQASARCASGQKAHRLSINAVAVASCGFHVRKVLDSCMMTGGTSGARKQKEEMPVGLVLFYITLAVLLISILASATCFSAYLVSRKRLLLFAFMAFLF